MSARISSITLPTILHCDSICSQKACVLHGFCYRVIRAYVGLSMWICITGARSGTSVYVVWSWCAIIREINPVPRLLPKKRRKELAKMSTREQKRDDAKFSILQTHPSYRKPYINFVQLTTKFCLLQTEQDSTLVVLQFTQISCSFPLSLLLENPSEENILQLLQSF